MYNDYGKVLIKYLERSLAENVLIETLGSISKMFLEMENDLGRKPMEIELCAELDLKA